MNTTTYMPETATEPIEEQPYFIAMSSGWTRFENSIYGDYDTNGCKPGLISYLDILEKTLYPILVRLTVGYSRTWTRVSLTNLQTLTGLSRNSVISAGQSLIEKGLVESRNNGGVTEWRILPDAVLPFIAAKNAEERAKMCHSDKPASAPHEPNWRATRAELVHETRQTSAPHEPPTRKERKKVEKKRKKDSLAPKNGASPAPDISADLPEPLTTSPSQVTPIEVTPIQAEVVQPPPVPKSPPKPKAVVPLAVEKFREISQKYPNKALYALIAETVGEKAEDIQFWGEVILAYIGMGWNPVNVNGMLEFYKKRVLPSKQPVRGGQHANNGKNRGRATTPLPPPPDAGLGGTANGGRKVTFAEFVGKQPRV